MKVTGPQPKRKFPGKSDISIHMIYLRNLNKPLKATSRMESETVGSWRG